jgi:ribosomal protein S18 acetylase RimI-like enzyme
MEAMPIRPARRGDVPSLLLLWTAMMEENARLDPRLSLHPDARDHASRSLSAWVEDPARAVLVAEENGRLVVGYAAGVVSPGDGVRVPERLGQVSDCYVLPARRRRGIARRLATRLQDLLFERGADAVRLQAVSRNADALGFWRSLGYEVLEEVLERPPEPRGAPVPT